MTDQEALLRSRRNVLCSITCRLFDQRLEVKTRFPSRAGTVHGISWLYFVVWVCAMRPDAGGAGLIRGPVQQLPFELSLRLCFYAFLYPTGRVVGSGESVRTVCIPITVNQELPSPIGGTPTHPELRWGDLKGMSA